MTWLWLRFAIRQLLRTLGQHRAVLPLVVISVLTIPTAIVATNEMAPHGFTVFLRLGAAAPSKLVYGYVMLMLILLFPLQIQLVHELDSSQEIENLERYPLSPRSIFHFKLIDQMVMYVPLLVLALIVTLVGGLYQAPADERTTPFRSAAVTIRAPIIGGDEAAQDAGPVVAAALERAREVTMHVWMERVEDRLERRAAEGVSAASLEAERAEELRKAEFVLPLCDTRVAEAVAAVAEGEPVRTQEVFAVHMWEQSVHQRVAADGPFESVGDFYPVATRLWRDMRMARPLRRVSQIALCGCLLLLAVLVQLGTLLMVTAALGLVPKRWTRSKGRVVLMLTCAMLVVLVGVALSYPHYDVRRVMVLPWVLVPLLVSLVDHGFYVEALVPAGYLAGYLVAAYVMAGWSYQRHLLDHREDLIARLTRLLGHSREVTRRARGISAPRGLLGLWAEPIPLLVQKDLKQITRPPVNRLMLLLLCLPFGCLLAFVGLGVAVGADNPFTQGRLPLFGQAALMLALYGILTLFWIPCSQIFLFSYERWGLTPMWYGPFDGRTVYRAKSVSAGLVVLPALVLAYGGMAMFIAVGGNASGLGLLAFGVLFVGTSTWLFGSLVASLGILFPYYLQTRFRQLAGGMGFLMQLTLLPVWIYTWLIGLVSVQFFGAKGLAILAGSLIIWFGFARILAREAHHAIDKVRTELGKTAGTRSG